ncbi:MAG: DNA topoisomerase IV [Algoriphagus sp.]|uniref:DNA topoisomerase IV n=1 Tax=Algoriphagus sp. TaxID=1872435 RepID=UPI00183A7F4D|nr:DNA topoisomerase IV [Algoriphagus sp.]NVJ86112.1 DNA topoisomerase IV [Algoriphagus sp.]
MYYRFGKAFYFLSILFFLFFLLYFYSALPEQVSLRPSSEGEETFRWSRGNFFYGMVALFVLFNAIALLPPKMLETKTSMKLHRIFPKGDPFRDYILTWFYSFGGILNLSLGMMVFYTHSINNQQEIGSDQFSFFFYLIPILLAVWVLALFLLFVGKTKQLQNQSE